MVTVAAVAKLNTMVPAVVLNRDESQDAPTYYVCAVVRVTARVPMPDATSGSAPAPRVTMVLAGVESFCNRTKVRLRSVTVIVTVPAVTGEEEFLATPVPITVTAVNTVAAISYLR